MTAKSIRFLAYAVLGGGAVVASVYYLSRLVLTHWERLSRLTLDGGLVAAVLIGALVYAATLTVLASGWMGLLGAAGIGGVRWPRAVCLFARANLSKYLPGSVFHFAARQVFAHAEGWPQGPVAGVSVLETLLMVATASALTVLGWWVAPPGAQVDGTMAAGVAGTVMASWAIGLWAVRQPVIARFALAETAGALLRSASLLWAVGAYATVFVAWAAVYALAAHGLDGAPPWGHLPEIVAALSFSWFVALVAPFAPGGLGVREAALVLMLGPLFGEPETLLTAVVFRAQTVLGEIILFLTTFLPGLRPAERKA